MKKTVLLRGLLILASVASLASCGDDPLCPGDPSCDNPTPICPGDPSCDDPTPDDLVTPPAYDEVSFQLHYSRPDRNFVAWELWLWTVGEGDYYSFNGVDVYGAVAAYTLSALNVQEDGVLNFIVKGAGEWTSNTPKDTGEDRAYSFADGVKDANDIYHFYLKSGDSNIYHNAD